MTPESNAPSPPAHMISKMGRSSKRRSRWRILESGWNNPEIAESNKRYLSQKLHDNWYKEPTKKTILKLTIAGVLCPVVCNETLGTPGERAAPLETLKRTNPSEVSLGRKHTKPLAYIDTKNIYQSNKTIRVKFWTVWFFHSVNILW